MPIGTCSSVHTANGIMIPIKFSKSYSACTFPLRLFCSVPSSNIHYASILSSHPQSCFSRASVQLLIIRDTVERVVCWRNKKPLMSTECFCTVRIKARLTFNFFWLWGINRATELWCVKITANFNVSFGTNMMRALATLKAFHSPEKQKSSSPNFAYSHSQSIAIRTI